jgi:hypothetical protein
MQGFFMEYDVKQAAIRRAIWTARWRRSWIFRIARTARSGRRSERATGDSKAPFFQVFSIRNDKDTILTEGQTVSGEGGCSCPKTEGQRLENRPRSTQYGNLFLPKGKVKAHTATKKCKPNLVSLLAGPKHELLLCRPILTIPQSRTCLLGQMGV